MKKQLKFFYTYAGGKSKDLKDIQKWVNLEGCDTICEPFCGSCAFSIYSKHDIKKFLLTDVDKFLIGFVEDVKNGKLNEYLEFIKEHINEYCVDNKPTKKWYELRKQKIKTKYEDYLLRRMSIMRSGIMAVNYKEKNRTLEKVLTKNCDIEKYEYVSNFFANKQCIVRCENYKQIFDEVMNKKNVFVFLDPPYLVSFNKSYDDNGRDLGEIYIDILDLLKNAKCKILYIINKNAITSYIFKDFIKGEYVKRYDVSHIRTIHLIITNY